MVAGGKAAVDRGQIERFLATCIDVLASEGTRAALKDPASGRPGRKIVELQQGVWDDLGVPAEAGRSAVGGIEKNFPEDHAALVSLRDDFAKAADAAYLRCLEDRRPPALENKAKMPRAIVLEFFDACSLMLDTPEVRERLRISVAEKGAMPDAVVNEVHGEVMELLGFEAAHGQSCFEELGKANEFWKDREVAVGYARWRGKTSSICLRLLNEYRKMGGELHVDDEVKEKLLELQAKDELDAMSVDERAQLLERNAKKVNVFRGLPDEGRRRYLERLSDQEKVELAKSEILMVTLMQAQQRMAHDAASRAE
uniref:Uncharacterized protein n=1 Tax=Alexandrium catenella TaxID=2925 RepID=A0A7S1WFY8_ALECA